jgi:hypothetical protein
MTISTAREGRGGVVARGFAFSYEEASISSSGEELEIGCLASGDASMSLRFLGAKVSVSEIRNLRSGLPFWAFRFTTREALKELEPREEGVSTTCCQRKRSAHTAIGYLSG